MAAQGASIIEELAEQLDGVKGEEALEEPAYGEEEKAKPSEEDADAAKDKAEPVEKVAKPAKEEKPLPETVPYSRFREVNEQRREAQEQRENLAREVSELRGEVTSLLRKGEVKAPPDPAVDPDAYIAHITAENAKLQGILREASTRQTQNQQTLDQQP